jgi:hypothetical protein
MSITSTNNGIVLDPEEITDTGTITLVTDLKANFDTVSENIALGKNQMQTLPTGTSNFAFGNYQMSNLGASDYNIAIGTGNFESSDGLATFNNNISVGLYNLYKVENGSNNNTGIGEQVFSESVNGSNNIGIGENLVNVVVGSNNTVMGSNIIFEQDGTNSLTGSNNTILANNCLLAGNSVVDDVILIGSNSLNASASSSNEVVLGTLNMQNMTSTNNNKVIGRNNLNGTGNAINNCVIGAGCLATQENPTSNIIIGSNVLNIGTTANSNIIIGNNAGSDGTSVTDSIMIGSNNGEFTNNINRAILVGTNIQMNFPTSDYTTVLGGHNTVVPTGNPSNTTLIQGNNVGIGSAVLNPRYDVETENKLALRSAFNFRSLKNVSWNYSNIFAFSIFDNVSSFAQIDLENDIKWEPDIAGSSGNKSVMLTLEFSCMQLSDEGTFYGCAGGSVSFMIHKNAGNWIFPDSSTSYSLLSNAQTRGTYSYMAGGGNINAVNVSQSTFGNPNISFWLKYGSLVQCPNGTWSNYGTCSTQIRAQCSTNLVN